ncbi:DUF7447 family protein [Acidithiobacillus ferrivorans]|uniref:DUF7447 family protein n=1 Tax=Acidithiobacillus ferrivorans TaxID=160808 RepID=UPI00055324BE|nr:hypothetical protein [Acidithiobacillus ferrivorans]
MFFSIKAIKAANRGADQHFFDRSTMSFFQSRVCRKLTGHYFVTSEQCRFDPRAKRTYTLRQVTDNGWISTVGDYGAYSTSRAAHAEAARLWAQDCVEIQQGEESDAGRWEAYTAA